MDLKAKKVLVIGLARTGRECARFLAQQGARVWISDLRGPDELRDEMAALSGLSPTYRLGGEEKSWLDGMDCVVPSPGVPRENPLLREALARNIPILSEIELAYRYFTAPLVAFVLVWRRPDLATAWVVKRTKPTIQPVELTTTPSSATLEMVFVLDTTGSMGGLLEGAKQRIWGIVNEVMQSASHPSVRIGLVAYRDRGDQYVTQVLPLTDDLDKVYTTLMNYQAGGGGDTEEDVRRALSDGMKQAGWSRNSSRNSSNLAQVIFLVGDAPPHDDYKDEPTTLETARTAVQQGMVVNTIQCGSMPQTQQIWQSIAQYGQGKYFAIPQDGGVQTIATPYDEQLSQLGTKLGGTFLAYGGGGGESGERYREDAGKMAGLTESSVAASAPSAARAERTVNKAVNAKAYIGDLLQNLENGSVKLEDVKDEDLPTDLQKLSADDQRKEIDKRLAERRGIRAQIMALSKQRADYLTAERKKLSGADNRNSFDAAVSAALKEQLARKGIK
jgi:Mg-chelatase subunit ChlD